MINTPMAEKISIIRLNDGRVMVNIPSSFKEMVVSLGEGYTMNIWVMNVLRVHLKTPERDLCLIERPILYEGENPDDDG